MKDYKAGIYLRLSKEDSETNKIMAVTDDLTFEQFKTWVETL